MILEAFNANDTVDEPRMRDSFLPKLSQIETDIKALLAGAYEAWPLGQVLFNLNASPLADQVSEQVFVQSFYAVHQYFKRPGTFEFYLTVCRVIWGEEVDVEFVIPSPGRLQINIEATSIGKENFLARSIVDNAYVYDEIIDEEGDNIAFQVVQGPKSQNETDALFYELAPDGIFVEADLTLT